MLRNLAELASADFQFSAPISMFTVFNFEFLKSYKFLKIYKSL